MSKNILMIVGSLRKQSFNRQLAEHAVKLVGDRAMVSFLDYSALPFINQDAEFPAPDSAARVREQVAAADGIWIFTPEYNSSYPGALKNLLDWMSRPLKPNDYAFGTTISGKKVTISGVGGKMATAGSRAKLGELLDFIGADRMKQPETGVSAGREAFKTDILNLTPENEAALQKQVDAFLLYLN